MPCSGTLVASRASPLLLRPCSIVAPTPTPVRLTNFLTRFPYQNYPKLPSYYQILLNPTQNNSKKQNQTNNDIHQSNQHEIEAFLQDLNF